jgi:hypothetical protein
MLSDNKDVLMASTEALTKQTGDAPYWFPGAHRRVDTNFQDWHDNVRQQMRATRSALFGFVIANNLTVPLIDGKERRAINTDVIANETAASGLLKTLRQRERKVTILQPSRFIQYQEPKMRFSWLGIEFVPTPTLLEERSLILQAGQEAIGEELPINDGFCFRLRIARGEGVLSPDQLAELSENIQRQPIPSPRLETAVPIRPHFV